MHPGDGVPGVVLDPHPGLTWYGCASGDDSPMIGSARGIPAPTTGREVWILGEVPNGDTAPMPDQRIVGETLSRVIRRDKGGLTDDEPPHGKQTSPPRSSIQRSLPSGCLTKRGRSCGSTSVTACGSRTSSRCSRVVRERWNLDAVVLRCLDVYVDRENVSGSGSRICFNRVPMRMPRHGRWAPVRDLAPLGLPADPSPECSRPPCVSLMEPSPPARQPWAERGSLEGAEASGDAALRDAGLPPRTNRQRSSAPGDSRSWFRSGLPPATFTSRRRLGERWNIAPGPENAHSSSPTRPR